MIVQIVHKGPDKVVCNSVPVGSRVDLGLFTLAGREKHVAILTVHSTEGFLLVCILVGYIVWQKTANNNIEHDVTYNSGNPLASCFRFSQDKFTGISYMK